MEKRVVLFLVLSLTIIFGYDLLLKQFGFSPLQDSPILDQPETLPPDKLMEGDSPSISGPPDQGGNVEESLSMASEPPSNLEQSDTVETPLYTVKMTNKGGQITSWTLKNYQTQGEDPAPVDLVYSEAQFPGPLSLRVSNDTVTEEIQGGVYSVKKIFRNWIATNPLVVSPTATNLPMTGFGLKKN